MVFLEDIHGTVPSIIVRVDGRADPEKDRRAISVLFVYPIIEIIIQSSLRIYQALPPINPLTISSARPIHPLSSLVHRIFSIDLQNSLAFRHCGLLQGTGSFS